MLSGIGEGRFQPERIEIMGSGFDPAQDWVYVGYEKDGKTGIRTYYGDVLTIKSGRITFGVRSMPHLDKTFKVYLDRETTKMALTKDPDLHDADRCRGLHSRSLLPGHADVDAPAAG